jgi:hypothetical protein
MKRDRIKTLQPSEINDKGEYKPAQYKRVAKKEPDLSDLEPGLAIDKHDLEQACLQQPDLFYRAAKQLAECVSLRDAAAQAVKEEEASADERIRADAARAGDKITEKEIEAMKLRDDDISLLRLDYLEHAKHVGQWGALKEAFQQRSYVLKDLVNMHLAGHYGSIDGQKQEQADYARRVNDQRRKERRT